MPSEQEIRKRLEAVREVLVDAEQERDAAMVEAWHAGWNLREIGEAVGLTYVTVGSHLDRLKVRRRLTQAELARLRKRFPE